MVMSVVFMWGAYICMGLRCGCCSQSMGAYYPDFMTWKKAVGDLIFSHTHFGFESSVGSTQLVWLIVSRGSSPLLVFEVKD